ncbi:MAG: hypothetical protein AB1410_09325 [Acidobacteriota bacterium]
MRVRIKAFGILRKYIPSERNVFELEIESNHSVLDIVTNLKIPKDYIHAITSQNHNKTVDFSYIPQDGDEIVLIPVMGGG